MLSGPATFQALPQTSVNPRIHGNGPAPVFSQPPVPELRPRTLPSDQRRHAVRQCGKIILLTRKMLV